MRRKTAADRGFEAKARRDAAGVPRERGREGLSAISPTQIGHCVGTAWRHDNEGRKEGRKEERKGKEARAAACILFIVSLYLRERCLHEFLGQGKTCGVLL